MVEPEPARAPVMPPMFVPKVQLNVLDMVAVKDILGPVLLQMFAAAALVIAGRGLTVTVIV